MIPGFLHETTQRGNRSQKDLLLFFHYSFICAPVNDAMVVGQAFYPIDIVGSCPLFG
jgi:hypothetical protein